VHAFDTRTSQQRRFSGRFFFDCTGHATLGFLAAADWEMTPQGRMGMSNMWRWAAADAAVEFPPTPWALPLTMKDFPYPRDGLGEWFWESGFDKDPLGDAEGIRDWNLRAVYGAFQAMKNGDGRDRHANAELVWVAFIGGPRESRRLMGDVILSQDDIVTKKSFPDGCVPSTWSIDLHYPKQQFAEKFPDNPFISIAEHDRRIDRMFGYPIPYRCFYSRNVENLFMAGRCISVTHEALGTTRVMKTCGMMGEVVGKAASVCVVHDCQPRQVYTHYLDELQQLLQLPGRARRETVFSPLVIPKDVPVARPEGPPTGIDVASLPGIVVDDPQAEKSGTWTEGAGLKGYVGYGYLYAGADSGASIRFVLRAEQAGPYDIRLAYQPHANRGATVPVRWKSPAGEQETRIDMRQPPAGERGFVTLGRIQLGPQQECTVTITTEGAQGFVHADAVQLLPVPRN
ncbi:MAG: FAD-dependent oxidoreductase, partial [Pirellulaceae bacterium]